MPTIEDNAPDILRERVLEANAVARAAGATTITPSQIDAFFQGIAVALKSDDDEGAILDVFLATIFDWATGGILSTTSHGAVPA